MTLLAKGRVLARAWSMQIAAIGAALYATLLALDAPALQHAWETMPAALRDLLPAHVQAWIGLALFIAVMIARAAPQPQVDRRLAMLGAPATPLSAMAAAARPGAGKVELAWMIAAQTAVTRRITSIAIHCSATPAGRDVTAATIRGWHLAKKWRDIGYHFVIRLDGTIEVGRPLALIGAHVEGHNQGSIGICYVGGLAADGKTAADTRTPEQKEALRVLLLELKRRWPAAEIKGHRDYSPDRNGDGRITRNEWLKECPSFDARAEYARLGR